MSRLITPKYYGLLVVSGFLQLVVVGREVAQYPNNAASFIHIFMAGCFARDNGTI